MNDDLDDPGAALALAEALAAKLAQQLDVFDVQVITLTREEAVVAIGLVNAVIDSLRNQRIH